MIIEVKKSRLEVLLYIYREIMKRPENISGQSTTDKRDRSKLLVYNCSKKMKLTRIERFSPDGELECSRLFAATPSSFDVNTTI